MLSGVCLNLRTDNTRRCGLWAVSLLVANAPLGTNINPQGRWDAEGRRALPLFNFAMNLQLL